MRYIIRSVKYFFYFAFLTSLIIAALILTGLAEGDINTMFRGGASAIWKMALFFVAVAAVYPKVGFICRQVRSERPLNEVCDMISGYFRERNYELEESDGQKMTFRYKGTAGRITRMLEDRITLTANEGGFSVEGLRKDVFRISTGLEYMLNPNKES